MEYKVSLEIPDFYMCHPTYFGVNYEINSWMNIKNKPDILLAYKQWGELYSQLKYCGAKIELVAPQNHPDLVYIADSGIIYDNKFVVSNFKYDERKLERPFWLDFFSKYYHIITIPDQEFYEGTGDSFIIDKNIFCGYGFRTTQKALFHICKHIKLKPYLLKLINERFYHLDTCFSPLDKNHIIFYPDAFAAESIKIIENNFNCYAIPEKEAIKFACNMVIFNKHAIIPKKCKVTSNILQKLGFNAYEVDLSEFMKAGGGAKCLTMRTSLI